MSKIKLRRLNKMAVSCHPNTKVGDYTPFYFCPRSVMLYIIHKGNHQDLGYKGGQESIVHLEADLHRVVQWANEQTPPSKWAFSDGNAAAFITGFYNSLDDLTKINWAAVQSNNFRDRTTKEGKQAEFLLHDKFPWLLIDKVGVCNQTQLEHVSQLLNQAQHCPTVTLESSWYY